MVDILYQPKNELISQIKQLNVFLSP